MINCPSVHSPLPGKDLEFLGGVLLQSPLGRDDTDRTSLEGTDYSDPTSPPSFPINTNCALLQSPAVPAIGIPPIPPKKKFKFKNYDSDNDACCGCDSDNQCGNFLDAVAGENDYDDDKDFIDTIVGECKDGNETTDDPGKFVLLTDSQIDELKVDRLGNELRK